MQFAIEVRCADQSKFHTALEILGRVWCPWDPQEDNETPSEVYTFLLAYAPAIART